MAALVGACLSRSAKTASALAVCHLAAPHNDGCVVCKGMATAPDPKFFDRKCRSLGANTQQTRALAYAAFGAATSDAELCRTVR